MKETIPYNRIYLTQLRWYSTGANKGSHPDRRKSRQNYASVTEVIHVYNCAHAAIKTIPLRPVESYITDCCIMAWNLAPCHDKIAQNFSPTATCMTLKHISKLTKKSLFTTVEYHHINEFRSQNSQYMWRRHSSTIIVLLNKYVLPRKKIYLN